MKRNIFILIGIIAITMGLITSFLMPQISKLVKTSNYRQSSLVIINNQNNSQLSNLDSSYFTGKELYNNSSVGKINNYQVANATGTVVLIPQTHRYPGSSVSDAVNDSAELAQNQIFDIMSDLHNSQNIKLVMTEGDPYGEVSTTKITTLQKKISLLHSFTNKISSLSSSSPVTNLVSKSATSYISSLNREIALDGAPIKLKAKDDEIILYGSENTETLNTCANIVRKLTYLQDRLTQLRPNSSATVTGQSTISGNSLDISSLMRLQSPINSLDYIFDMAIKISSLTGSNSSQISEARETYREIKNLEEVEQQNLDTSNNAPSRSDNPYANIYDPSIIQKEINKTNSEINSIVIDQRNRETAENFSSALTQTDQKIGIIAFGSGHEEGLIKELNNKGLSVVVISPKEVVSPTKKNK